jgi:predicted 3-demethylubiquinone-9 3-methyltransferase (glyoxalase superfamily)
MATLDRRMLLKSGVIGSVALCSTDVLAQVGTNPVATSNEPAITVFLMFDGKAEQAMNFYVALFEKSKIVDISRYGPNEEGKEGSIKHAVFALNGQELMCVDSSVKHNFTFTPAISLFVSCPDENKITHYFETLSKDGKVLMPLDNYPFSKKFAWVQDKFGVSWQLHTG